jgi:hypothetical protein
MTIWILTKKTLIVLNVLTWERSSLSLPLNCVGVAISACKLSSWLLDKDTVASDE